MHFNNNLGSCGVAEIKQYKEIWEILGGKILRCGKHGLRRMNKGDGKDDGEGLS